MRISFKTSVIYSTFLFCGIFSSSNCMNYNNQQLFNNINTNNNSSSTYNQSLYQSDNEIKNFYSNKNEIKNYLKSKIAKISNNENGIKLNTNTIDNFDWKLFSYNIRNSASARANLQMCLKSLSNGSEHLETLSNVFYFYFNILPNKKSDCNIENNAKELLCMILYYYLYLIDNGYGNNLSNIQNNLYSQTISQDKLQEVLNLYGFKQYFNDYYLTKLNKQNYTDKETLYNVTLDNLKSAISAIKEIDLASILKNVIIGINIGETLFHREELNEASNAKEPLLLNNGHLQCWFRSTLQLLNSAIELCPKEIKDKLTSKPEYILVDFLKYIQKHSKNQFNTNDSKLSVVNEKCHSIGVSFHTAFLNFEKNLSNGAKQAREKIRSITEAKQILEYINYHTSNITIALPILVKLFPEIQYLFPEEQLNLGMYIFDQYIGKINEEILKQYLAKENGYYENIAKIFMPTNVYFLDNAIDDTDNEDFKPIPKYYYFNQYFFILEHNCESKLYNMKTSLTNQIITHQYRVGWDNNENLLIYTLKGLQLVSRELNHFWAHIALENASNGWYFADSTKFYSNPAYSVGMLAAASSELYNHDYGAGKVYAFMYRKINNNEILKYMS